MRRSVLGFLAAPLWAPLLTEANALRTGGHSLAIELGAALGASILAYAFTFVIGFSLVRWLGKRLRLWMLVLAGVATGLLNCLVAIALFWRPVYFRYGLTPDVVISNLGPWIEPAVILSAIGALIGCTYWLIARREYLPEDNAQYF